MKGWGAAALLSFCRLGLQLQLSHLSIPARPWAVGQGWPISPGSPAASWRFPVPHGYETPTTYRTAASWEEGKFQEQCGREQDWACSWVPGQPCWLISSCDWGLGVALWWGSLALADLAVSLCSSLFWADGSRVWPPSRYGIPGEQQEGQPGMGRNKFSPLTASRADTLHLE